MSKIEDSGYIQAANYSLVSILNQLAGALVEAKICINHAIETNRPLNPTEVSILGILDETFEEASMIWAQYRQDILGIDTGLGESELYD